MNELLTRVDAFCARFALEEPILLAPMAGACPPSLSIAVANAGGLGACGALLMKPAEIDAWAAAFRADSKGPFNAASRPRCDAQKAGDVERMQAWAGESAAMARAEPAARIVDETRARARSMLAV